MVELLPVQRAMEFEALLRAVGARIVVAETLPPGPGIFADEVGGAGPWYGIEFDHGYRYGWTREREALYDEEIVVRHVGPVVALRRTSLALLTARAEALKEAARVAREFRPASACWCGEYAHQPGCLVGESIAVAEEIESLPVGGAA